MSDPWYDGRSVEEVRARQEREAEFWRGIRRGYWRVFLGLLVFGVLFVLVTAVYTFVVMR